MKQKRIFIENLPETVTETEIKSKFSKFGDVTSIEIKERKVVTIKNSSCFFAYINVKTDDSGIQKCFQTFNETPWCGEYVKLQIAKESFLERLKREREAKETSNITSEPSTRENTELITTRLHEKSASVENERSATYMFSKNNEENKNQSKPIKRKKELSTSSSDSSEEDENIVKKIEIKNFDFSEENKKGEEIENIIQLKKTNRGAKFVNGLLKIEDFGKGSIGGITTKENEKTLDKRQAEAEARRKNALMEKIKAYRQQKSAFNQFQKKPKIIRFNDDDDVEVEQNGNAYENKKKSSNKMSLFENSDSEIDELNIQNKIENRIKSDERFALDGRFFEEEKQDLSNNQEDIDFIEEKQRESEILEEILGKNLKLNKMNDQTGPRYVRYDPSNPDHSKYELKEETETQKRSKKKKKINEKKAEEKDAPEVSKDRCHSVKVDLKAALGQSGGFSLSAIIGDTKQKVDNSVSEGETYLPLPTFSLMEENPYKYDSSDNEDETVHLEEKEKLPATQKPKKVWTEPFFFQENDFRFQEGLDFVKRIATQNREGEFEDTRRQFKQIVRNKIRHAKKKNKPFQRKLGGTKKKKIKRMDKALKR